jgi:hypothetical protein
VLLRAGNREPGNWKDTIFLDRSPLTAPKEMLKRTAIDRLFLKGKTWAGVGTLPGVVVRGVI